MVSVSVAAKPEATRRPNVQLWPVAWLIDWLRRRSLDAFVAYRVLLGVGILAVVFARR